MKYITIAEAQRLTSPAPFGLVSAPKPDGGTNLAAVSWWTYLSNHPPMLGVCLSKRGYSGELIRAGSEFALNIVGENLADAALKCGRCSGRTENKAKAFKIPLEKAEKISAGIVSGSRAAFECALVSSFDAGDHTMYIGEIVSVHGDENIKQLFACDGYARLSTASERAEH